MALKSIDLPFPPARNPSFYSLGLPFGETAPRESRSKARDPDIGKSKVKFASPSSSANLAVFHPRVLPRTLSLNRSSRGSEDRGNKLFRQVGRLPIVSKLSTSRRRNEPIGHHCRFDSVIKVRSFRSLALFYPPISLSLSKPVRKGRARRHNKTINSDSCEAELLLDTMEQLGPTTSSVPHYLFH